MSHLVTFPWTDREEVTKVFEELYSDDVISQKHAIDRISVWKCRVTSRLPSAVESTAAFVSAMTESSSCGSSYSDTLHLRSMYSMALIRFVNHITERGQQGPHARPVHIIASEFGVPEWIVELRHAATHGTLPSLSELKAATCWGLKWLKEKFWNVQIAQAYGVSSLRAAALEMLMESLVTYMQQKFQEINGGGPILCKQVLTDIEHMLFQLGGEACSVLIEDGYLIFSKEQLECIGFSLSDLQLSKTLLLPQKIIEFWSPVIQLICKADLLATQVLLMVSAVTEEKSHRNTLLLAWIYSIVWYNNKKQLKKSGSKPIKICEDIPYKAILEKCVHLCSSDSQSLINLLIDKSEMSLLQKQKLRELLGINKYSNFCEDGIGSQPQVYSVNDLNASNGSDTIATPWKKSSVPVEWSLLSFGILPDQNIGYKSLELDYAVSEADMGGETERESISLEYENDLTEPINSCMQLNENASDKVDEFVLQWDEMTQKSITNKIVIF